MLQCTAEKTELHETPKDDTHFELSQRTHMPAVRTSDTPGHLDHQEAEGLVSSCP